MNNEEALDLAHRDHFTVPEWCEREKHIATIRQFDKSRLLAEQALTQIRDKKLYRPYGSLKEFCSRTFGWSERHTYRMLKSEETISALPKKYDQLVTTESQARELAKVPESKRVEVLDDAITNGEVTAKAIRESSKKVDTWPKDKAGTQIPASALPFWSRRHEIQTILNHISDARSQIRNITENDALYQRVGGLGNIRRELDGMYNQFKGILPDYVCGYCHGKNISLCRGCGGTGLLSEYMRKSLPKEMKPEMPF